MARQATFRVPDDSGSGPDIESEGAHFYDGFGKVVLSGTIGERGPIRFAKTNEDFQAYLDSATTADS